MPAGGTATYGAGSVIADGTGAESDQDRGDCAVHAIFQLRAERVHAREEA